MSYQRVAGGLAGLAMVLGVQTFLPAQASALEGTSITVASSPAVGVWGTRFTIRSVVRCNGTALPDAPIEVIRRLAGTTDMVTLARGSTDANGVFSLGDEPPATSEYTVLMAGTSSCAAAAAILAVGVRPSIALNPAGSLTPAGAAAVFRGRVVPAHPGQVVVLQTYRGDFGQWVFHSLTRLDAASEFRFGYRKASPGALIFRVTYPTQHRDHLWNVSRNVRADWFPAPAVPAPVSLPATPTSRGCHSSYRGQCLRPDASDYDCIGGSGNGPYYTGRVQVVGPDVFGLDRDHDGIGCE